jgi:NTE family protein
VLSGGGAKGVYHIGVWRALKELGIRVDAFVGASIGAAIAALLAQGADEELEAIGRSITLSNIVALPEGLTEDGELRLDKKSLSAARRLLDAVVSGAGLDTSPFRQLLEGCVSEETIRNSGKDLGIVTVNLSAFEPRELFLEHIELGRLIDYLMASSAFPGFESPVIDGSKYLDGGLHDNIPYAMARKRGYNRIIISDISGAGRNRRPQIEGSATVYIKNSIDMGGVLDFDRDFLDRFTRLGYLDTMRAFGRYAGYSFFLEPNPEAERAFAASAGSASGDDFPNRMRYDRNRLLKYLECAAAVVGVERNAVYGYRDLDAAIGERKRLEDERVAEATAVDAFAQAGLVAKLRRALDEQRLDGSPYYYWRLADALFSAAARPLPRSVLVGLYPELPAGLRYIESWLGQTKNV